MMENVTTPDQYELLEMSKISGFIDRARGTGRPTKKDRRNLEEFTTPEFMDDFDFEFDSIAKTNRIKRLSKVFLCYNIVILGTNYRMLVL